MLLGLIAGTISVIGYMVIQQRLQKAIGGVDTCGIHNLHGMPDVFLGLVAVGLVSYPLWQLTETFLSIIFATLMGIVVGFIASLPGKKETLYSDEEEFGAIREKFSDCKNWSIYYAIKTLIPLTQQSRTLKIYT